MALASLLLVFVVVVSIPAHPDGRALHDLFSGTAVMSVGEATGDSSEVEPEHEGADSGADTES